MSFKLRRLFGRGSPEVPPPTARPRSTQELVDRGIVAEKSGSMGDALKCYREAIEADSGFAPAHLNLGIALFATGDLAGAIASYGRAITLDPEKPVAHFNRGLAYLKLGKYREAENDFRAALGLKSGFPEAWVGLADALEGHGHNQEALGALQTAIEQRPDYAGALFNASLLLSRMGRLDAAVDYGRRALDVEPEHYLEHSRLGSTLHRLGRLTEAAASYQHALALKPDYLDARLQLACVLQEQGRKQESLQLLFDAVASEPDNLQARSDLARTLQGVVLDTAGEKERNVLLSLCVDDSVSTRFLSTAIFGLLKNNDAFRLLQNSAQRGEDPFPLMDPMVDMYLRDPLLTAAVTRISIMDAPFEEVMTRVRRNLLLQVVALSDWSAHDPNFPTALMCAIAGQCLVSGYAFFADEEELEQVATLQDAIQARLREERVDSASVETALTAFAMYDYPQTIVGGERLLEIPDSDWSEPFRLIVVEQLKNYQKEREISTQISLMTSIADAVSVKVRNQYEGHPYPVWVGLSRGGSRTVEELARSLMPDQPVRAHPLPVPMLIAGCGSGEVPIRFAMTYPECDLLAIDLSLASLSYAARMTERYGVSNITYRQADILQLGNLEQQFAVIECSGVLHHLNDPMEGWRILHGLMAADGLMRIGLYSAKARSELQAARDFVRALNLPLTTEGTRCGRRAIMSLPNGHPAKEAMSWGDFYTLNGFRDLLMHVQEHQFTLPEVANCLDELGLRFLGMECSAETNRRFLEMFPANGAAFDLALWDRLEDAYPRSFRGMYSFWCCRKDYGGSA